MPHTKTKYLPILFLPLIVILCFGIWFSQMPGNAMVGWPYENPEDAVFDMRDLDFSQQSYYVSRWVEYIPNALLTPEEFAGRDDIVIGKVPEEMDVCTMRIRLLMPDDRAYGIVGYPTNYACSVYINDKWLFDNGVPGETIDLEQASEAYRLYSVVPVDGEIEILMQTSSFANVDTSSGMNWCIGDYEQLRQHYNHTVMVDTAIIMIYAVAALVALLFFLMLPSNRGNLWLALLALVWVVRISLKNRKLLLTLIPDLAWPIAYKIEILTTPLTIMLVVLILHAFFSGALPKWVRGVLIGGSWAGVIFVLVRPWYTFFGHSSFTNPIIYWALMAMLVFIVLHFIRKKQTPSLAQIVALAGIGFVLLAFIWDHGYFSLGTLPHSLTQPATLIFILFMLTGGILDTMQRTVHREVELTKIVETQEREVAESRISVMLSQIQPHFLYNSLSSISALCDVAPQDVKGAVQSFAHYLRGNLEALNQHDLIPFEDELSHLETYLSLEKLRHGDELRIEYDIQIEGFNLPPLTVQPIVENAVKHGIARKQGGGTVRVSTMPDNESVVITISDDGTGFGGETESEHKHVGIDNVRKRLAAQCGGTLDIVSVPDEGTTATITIPYVSDKGGDR